MPPEGRFTTPTKQNAVFSADFNDGIITNATRVREALIEVDLISASPNNAMPSTERIYAGIDAGGSKTELLAAQTQGEELLNLFGPCGNPARTGFGESADVLAQLILQTIERFGEERIASICAGVAGAGRMQDQQLLYENIRERLPASTRAIPLCVTHDSRIALEAAFEGESGVMVISGTGAVSLARTRTGEFLRAGGWGYLIGDEGSGYALGAAGLRAVAHAFDGGPDTALRTLLAASGEITGRTDLFEVVYKAKTPLQKFARTVIEAAQAGDAVAAAIIRKNIALLTEQIGWLVARCADIRPRITLLGGLSGNPFYRERLQGALLERLPDWECVEPLNRPVVGAWRMARDEAAANA